MLLILGNVVKMLPVKSEGACSPLLVPGRAHLISQDYSGKIPNDLASNSAPGYFKILSRKTSNCLTKALISLQKMGFD